MLCKVIGQTTIVRQWPIERWVLSRRLTGLEQIRTAGHAMSSKPLGMVTLHSRLLDCIACSKGDKEGTESRKDLLRLAICRAA